MLKSRCMYMNNIKHIVSKKKTYILIVFNFIFIQTCLIQNICIHINNTVKVNYQNIYLYID